MPIIPSSNPGSKAISLGGIQTCGSYNQSIEKELSGPGTASISMNCCSVRSLLGVPSGAISFSNAYGKSSFPGKMIVMVVGGGGGTAPAGGGGGAGGYRVSYLCNVSGSTPFTVTIGSGGSTGTGPVAGSPGSPTTIVGPPTYAVYTGYGGGAGGSYYAPPTIIQGLGYPGAGAGAGGGGYTCFNPGPGSASGGLGNFPGGCALASCPSHGVYVSGGGGGTTGGGYPGVFTNPSPSGASAANGGAGIQFLDGNAYGGGGGGTQASTTGTGIPNPYTFGRPYGVGGLGGGGTGLHYIPSGSSGTIVRATSGTPGTGGGGGGGGYPGLGGCGGPGAAVFIYSSPTQLATGGDTITNQPTLTFPQYYPAAGTTPRVGCGPYWIHKFTTPGTFTT